MMKRMIMLMFSFALIATLFACTDKKDEPVNDAAAKETVKDSEETEDLDEAQEDAEENNESTALPDGFPSDFPLPDNITITEVEDNSDDERYSFGIRFDFDPNIDMDETFSMYEEYANKLEYNTIIGGEEYFAEGIFQYGATSKMSASDMFVVTLKPEDNTFGDIQVKVSK